MMPFKIDMKVTVVKSVQIRHTMAGLAVANHTFNKRFINPTAAAKHWAYYAAANWQERMGEEAMDEVFEREQRYYKKALPIFTRMLKVD